MLAKPQPVQVTPTDAKDPITNMAPVAPVNVDDMIAMVGEIQPVLKTILDEFLNNVCVNGYSDPNAMIQTFDEIIKSLCA